MQIERCKRVEKVWGYEDIFVNCPMKNYCGKRIFVSPGKWSSNGLYHMHLRKDEVFFVERGSLLLDIAGVVYELQPAECFRVPPKTPHRFTSAKKYACVFYEASTYSSEDDTVRGTLEELNKNF